MSLYRLKPAFQNLLRPAVGWLASHGVRANGVTVLAAGLSVALGVWLSLRGLAEPGWFWLLPLWMLLRMAFNAADGMLAREYGHQSALGAYLNELCDVVSDAALLLPFAFVAPFGPLSVGLFMVTATWAELAGVLGPMVGASRRYDGPLGKSDRALVVGLLAAWVAWAGHLPAALAPLMPLLAGLCMLTLVRRVRAGLAQARSH